MPIAIVARTPIDGPTAGPPDLDHRRHAVRLSQRSDSRGDLYGNRVSFDRAPGNNERGINWRTIVDGRLFGAGGHRGPDGSRRCRGRFLGNFSRRFEGRRRNSG
jgi:hypothetical protein